METWLGYKWCYYLYNSRKIAHLYHCLELSPGHTRSLCGRRDKVETLGSEKDAKGYCKVCTNIKKEMS